MTLLPGKPTATLALGAAHADELLSDGPSDEAAGGDLEGERRGHVRGPDGAEAEGYCTHSRCHD